MAGGQRVCLLCDVSFEVRAFEKHMENHKEDLERVKFSNDMREAIKTRCLLCDTIIIVNRMRSHVKKHGITITEYKRDKLKGHSYQLLEKIFHRFH